MPKGVQKLSLLKTDLFAHKTSRYRFFSISVYWATKRTIWKDNSSVLLFLDRFHVIPPILHSDGTQRYNSSTPKKTSLIDGQFILFIFVRHYTGIKSKYDTECFFSRAVNYFFAFPLMCTMQKLLVSVFH